MEVQPRFGFNGHTGWAGFCLGYHVVSEKPVNRIQIVGSTAGTLGGWYVCHRADNLADSCRSVAAVGRVLIGFMSGNDFKKGKQGRKP